MTFRRFLIRGFRQKRFVQKLWRKNYFFAALARSALRRVRVKSDLLDETAIEASVVVACTKGSFHKKRCTYFAPSLYFLVKLTRPRLVHCAHAAIRPPTTPTAVWRKCTVPATLHPLPLLLLLLMSLLCHTRTPRLMHFCAFIALASTVSTLKKLLPC